MKYRFISDHRETFKVGRMCKLLNVSRSGYHAWFKLQRAVENARIVPWRRRSGFYMLQAMAYMAPQGFIRILAMTTSGAAKTVLLE